MQAKGGPASRRTANPRDLTLFRFFPAEPQHFLFWNSGFDPVPTAPLGPVQGLIRLANDFVGAQFRLRLADSNAHGNRQRYRRTGGSQVGDFALFLICSALWRPLDLAALLSAADSESGTLNVEPQQL